jgi:hypothetical protein
VFRFPSAFLLTFRPFGAFLVASAFVPRACRLLLGSRALLRRCLRLCWGFFLSWRLLLGGCFFRSRRFLLGRRLF